MGSYPKQTKRLNLDLSKIDRTLRKQFKQDVGNYLVNEIKRHTADGKSPVSGRNYKKLDKDYADEEKGGLRRPNLRGEGDLMEAVTFKNTAEGVEIGVFEGSQQGKADGHNNFSGDSKLPERRFVPGDDEDFTASIRKGVDRIRRDYEEESSKKEAATTAVTTAISERFRQTGARVTVSDLGLGTGTLFGDLFNGEI